MVECLKVTKDLEQWLFQKLHKRYMERVETAFCLEHNMFAKFIVEDATTFRWRIEGCCEALIKRAKDNIEQPDS